MKVCKSCNIRKDLESFHRHKIEKDGRTSVCKTCNAICRKQKLTEEEKEKQRVKSRLYRLNKPNEFRWTVKQSSYKKLGLNITKEEYDRKLKEQDGLCMICKKPPLGFKKSLCLDHDHISLKVRGFLCDNCNAGLGKFKDDLDILQKAIDYLKLFK